jgi:hypothetical protein
VSGLPWLPSGESKKIGFNELVAKCLCREHNSALSPLDSAAALFFDALRKADLNRSGPAFVRIVSGHDIERWMLKTLFAFAHSKNLAADGIRLEPSFRSGIEPVAMLTSPRTWPIGAGLSFQLSVGDGFLRADEFGLAPYTLPGSKEIVGMKSSVQGIALDLRAVPFDATSPGILRPSAIRFRHPAVVNEVILCWSDGQRHDPIEVTFAMTKGEADARVMQTPAAT